MNNRQPHDDAPTVHRNDFSGTAYAPVFQVRDVHGDVVIHHSATPAAPDPLHRALLAAIVVLRTEHSEVRGVRVAPDRVLTAAALLGLGDGSGGLGDHAGDGTGDGLALVTVPEGDDFAAVSSGLPAPALRLVAGTEPGSPVLDWRTGGVCGIVGPSGDVLAVPPLPDLSHRNDRWLDLLTTAQLAAGGRRHAGPVLREYLEAVRTADQEHQYEWARLVAPPLSRIYLRRQASPQQEDKLDDGAAPPERIAAEDLVAKFEGAQVLAEPGAGKSSLVRHVAAAAAERWLTDGVGEFVPVPITADALARHNSLPAALADGVLPGLSLTLDRERLVELFGAEPVPGVPWLVLVDGLDEVLDPGARALVTRRVEDHRRRAAYRFLVTSRPLNQRELRPLLDPKTTPTYLLERFSQQELQEFVRNWLREEGHPDPGHGAREFLAKVARTKLRELAHVPLIATMLCILLATDADLDPPGNQTELYRRFVTWQLSKVYAVNAREQLLTRLAPRGPAAQRAADHLVENLEVLLQDIAHQRLFDLGQDDSVLDLAVRWGGSSAVWSDVVPDVLRLSGLVQQRGRRFAFRHQTIEEFLAAAALARRHPDPRAPDSRRLLRPRDAWPWPDLAVKVFLAARWAEDGGDLSRPLRRLMRPWHRGHNLGFVAALVDHGVALPPDLVDGAVRRLSRMVAGRAGNEDWLRYAQWLREIAPDVAVRLLREIVPDRAKAEDRRYQALRFLHGFSAEDSAAVAMAFVGDPAVSRIARTTVGKMFLETAPEAGLALFVELATTAEHEHLRLQAAEVVASHDPGRGIDLLADVVSDASASDTVRLSAARDAFNRDRVRGVDLMCVLAATGATEHAREEAMSTVRGEDPDRLTALLERLRVSAAPGVQLHAARFLVKRLGRDLSVLVDLAANRELPPQLRMEALLVDRRAMTVDLVDDIVRGYDDGDAQKLWAIAQLAGLSSQATAPHYRALVANPKLPPFARLEAAMQASRHVSRDELVSFYGIIVADRAVPEGDRLTAARKAASVDRAGGARLMAVLARDTGVDGATRMAAAAEAGTDVQRAVYPSISRDPRHADSVRVTAAKKAHALRFWGDRELLRELARSSNLGMDARLSLARELSYAEQALVLTEIADDPAESAHTRLQAAQELGRVDTPQGLRVLRGMAEDKKLPGSVQRQARSAAEGLE